MHREQSIALDRLASTPRGVNSPAEDVIDVPLRTARTFPAHPPGRLARGEWSPYLVEVRDVPFDELLAYQLDVERTWVKRYIINPPERPIAVLRQPDGSLVVADGYHRLTALFLMGRNTVRAEVYDADRRKAERNSDHRYATAASALREKTHSTLADLSFALRSTIHDTAPWLRDPITRDRLARLLGARRVSYTRSKRNMAYDRIEAVW